MSFFKIVNAILDLLPNVLLSNILKQRNVVIDDWSIMSNVRFLPDPPDQNPEPVERTEDAMLLPNICHVMRNTRDEEDGLEIVEASYSERPLEWPFATCEYRKWGYDQKYGLHRYRDDTVRCDCPAIPGDHIHRCCEQALLRIARDDLDEAVVWYSKAVQLTPLNDCEARLQATAFCSLGIFLSSHLTQSIQHKFRKNDSKAVLLFKVGAVVLKSPYCMYFYGHALAHGQGGVNENRARSIHYLNLAGAEGVGEAFYELGKIHEEMGTENGSVTFNMISAAEEFYDAAQKAYTFVDDVKYFPFSPPPTHVPPPGAWTPWLATIQSLLDTEGLYTLESSLSSALGQRFSWGIAGQAFLIGGSIALAGKDLSDGFESFLWIIPSLGIIISLRSSSEAMEALFRSDTQRGAVHTMVLKKLMAYRAILVASINDSNWGYDLPDWHYFSWFLPSSEGPFKNWKKEVTKFQIYLIKISLILFFTGLTLWLTFAVNLFFLIAWSVLLINWFPLKL